MTTARRLKPSTLTKLPIPTRRSFVERLISDPICIHGMMDEECLSAALSDIINRDVHSAAEAAGVTWAACSGFGHADRVRLTKEAAERWLELMEIAAGESDDPTGAADLVRFMSDEWTDITRRFIGFRRQA